MMSVRQGCKFLKASTRHVLTHSTPASDEYIRMQRLRSEGRRSVAYLTLYIVLVCAALLLDSAAWKGNSEIHTLLETISTVLSLTTGAMALVYHYSKKTGGYLLLGCGFTCAGLLDGYHAVATSSFLAGVMPSSLATLTPWSGMIARLFLSVMMCASLKE